MALFELGLIIISMAILIAISLKFFWVASLLILYRAVTSLISYEFLSGKFEMSHTVYFIIILSVSVALHFGIAQLVGGWVILKYLIYIGLTIWIFYYFELNEIFLFKDWFNSVGFELSGGWFKEQVVDLSETETSSIWDRVKFYINKFAEGIENIINKIFK